MLILAAILSLTIGVSLGLLGGGGSILTVPLLVYALHVAPKPAIASSLFVVGITSLVGMIAHARAGSVRLRIGLLFGGAGMAGAYAGGRVSHFIPGEFLLLAFSVVMLVIAIAMLRPRRQISPPGPPSLGKVLLAGTLVGILSGLIGAGGGFLIVPALVLFGGLAMREAIGTSLLVITLQCFAGFAGQVEHVQINWSLTLVVSASAVAGSLAGVRLARRVSQNTLRNAFGWFVIAMGLFMLGKQLPLVPVLLLGVVAVSLALWISRTGRPPTAVPPPAEPCILSSVVYEHALPGGEKES